MGHGDSVSVSVSWVIWKYKSDFNSASGGNWKESSLLTISAKASFDGDTT